MFCPGRVLIAPSSVSLTADSFPPRGSRGRFFASPYHPPGVGGGQGLGPGRRVVGPYDGIWHRLPFTRPWRVWLPCSGRRAPVTAREERAAAGTSALGVVVGPYGGICRRLASNRPRWLSPPALRAAGVVGPYGGIWHRLPFTRPWRYSPPGYGRDLKRPYERWPLPFTIPPARA